MRKNLTIAIMILILILFVLMGMLFYVGDDQFKFFGDKGFNKKDVIVNEELNIYPMEPFVSNLSGESRYLRIKLNLNVHDEDFFDDLYEQNVALRELILRRISQKSRKEIETIEGKNKLLQEIKEIINTYLGKDVVKEIYLSDFVFT